MFTPGNAKPASNVYVQPTPLAKPSWVPKTDGHSNTNPASSASFAVQPPPVPRWKTHYATPR